MDGFASSDNVIVLASTNRPDILDRAALRPGRFDRKVFIEAPTVEGRQEHFRRLLRKFKTDKVRLMLLIWRLGSATSMCGIEPNERLADDSTTHQQR